MSSPSRALAEVHTPAPLAHLEVVADQARDYTAALYLTSQAGALKTSTLQRRLSAISQAHQVAGHETPTRSAAVRLVWAGIRRKHGTAQEGKAPALVEDLRAMMAAMAPRAS